MSCHVAKVNIALVADGPNNDGFFLSVGLKNNPIPRKLYKTRSRLIQLET